MQASNLSSKIGLIAGGGDLPLRVVQAAHQQGIDIFVVAFEGQTDPFTVQGCAHIWVRLGAAGTVLKALKEHGVKDLVLAGSIRRPSLAELMPDATALAFFSQAGMRALKGDDDLLQALRDFLADAGFAILGAQHIATDLLMPEGVLGKHKPSAEARADIARGIEVSQSLGQLDVGQCVIVQQGLVLGVEAIEGTDQLIQRCATLRRKGRGGVLIKTCKPQQDRNLDLPTIGLQTVQEAHRAGLSGLAVHAGAALLLDREQVISYANKHKLFLIGVPISS